MFDNIKHEDTLSTIREYFEKVGSNPKKQFGQNFLIDHNFLPIIVDSASINPGDYVLEVGPGFGVLTESLLAKGAEVTAVEIDPLLYEYCTQRFEGNDQVQLHNADILEGKHQLNREILEEINSKMKGRDAEQFKVVANLPYKISTPFFVQLIFGHHVPQSITVLIQEEFADRVLSPSKTKSYGTLSVYAQLMYNIDFLKVVGPRSFYPPPKVNSAIIHLEKKDRAFKLEKEFESYVGELFRFRRKKVKGLECRPGDLSPDEVISLYKKSRSE